MSLRKGRRGSRIHGAYLLERFPMINDWLGKIELTIDFALYSGRGASDLPWHELQTWYGGWRNLSLGGEQCSARLVPLAVQITWTASVENVLEAIVAPQSETDAVNQALDNHLLQQRVMTKGGFSWLYHFKFYLDRSISNPLDRLTVKAPDATFPYGWEYHGVLDELVQTPIMDRVYLTLTQALDDQLGGAPFGPGTTEFVKVLMLNRVDLVQSNGKNFRQSLSSSRLFHPLEERILGPVSQQVQTIQQGLVALLKNPNTEPMLDVLSYLPT
ncbi:hypothetical protein F5880DRAFT_1668069 [Lentinula raphanica]|nr:hypothetical protein F5880DRAFT_1668069 [Lentinula raphanica]